MYSNRAGLVFGFHGCDQSVCDQIICNKGNLNPSENAYDWLGNGVYFWENNIERAWQFALEQSVKPTPGRAKINRPAVFGAVLNLGFCLDLLDSKYLELLEVSYQSLLLSYDTLPKNKKSRSSDDLLIRHLDCLVIENLHQIHQGKRFDSVRGVFIEGGELYPEAGFNKKNHIQICIRNPNCIKGYFNPRILSPHWDNV